MEEFYNMTDEYGGLAEPKTSDEQILRQFKRKSVVAKDWIKDLVRIGYRKAVKTGKRRSAATLDEGFFMSDEMPDVGVLSIAPSLSALLSELTLLREGKDVATDAMSFTEMLTDNKNEVLNAVVDSICMLLAECYPDGLHTNIDDVLFSSAPFYEGITASGRSVWARDGYLDTASWAFLVADLIELFLNRFEECAPELYKKTKWTVYEGDEKETLSVEKVRDYVRTIYYASIRTTCDCIVKRDGKYLGWTFRKMKGGETQPSLYFSYVASTVYLGLYKRFNGTKEVIVNMRNFEDALQKKSKDENNDDIKKYKFYDGFKSAEKFNRMLEWMTRKEFHNTVKFLRTLSPNEIAELDLLYNVINDGKPLSFKLDDDDEGGSFTVLKEASTGLAAMLWNEGYGTYKNKIPFSENMAKGPCFEDGSLIEMEVIKRSSHNNSFFNNLFVIGIILNSAYDVELMKKDPKEYERMLNIFQLAIQNTQRCYDEIEERGLLYKIDSYILDFSDKVDSANTELAKQLRRVNMPVVPLMPLMLKNNNLMSQYVVQYPQKQMTESLRGIIKNRKYVGDAKEPCWVWDKDGYNSITNYYYVDALISFYRYYEQYEEPLIINEALIRRHETQAAENAQNQVQEKLDNEIKQLNAEISKLNDVNAEYKRIFKDFARLMINGLIDVVDEQITEAKLIGALSPEEKTNRDTIISELNSFNRESDTVKLSSLVHLTEKLQVLSLLSMDSNEQIRAFLKNSGPNKYDGHVNLIADAFGTNGNSTKFMRNLLIFIMDSLNANKKPD